MARMACATLQWDIMPLAAVIGFVTYEYEYASYRRLKPPGLKFLFQVLTLYYLIRLLMWAHIATQQLCERLDVWMFTIKPKAKKKKE
jgi:hypothetical protein